MQRKIYLTLASLLAGSAYGQSELTFYGVLDNALEALSNAPDNKGKPRSLTQIKSGSLWGSRWGLRGREDLGGGLSVIYKLESGFFSDTGASAQSGRLFGRGAYIGLDGKFGSVTAGRQTTLLYDMTLNYDPLAFAAYSVVSHDSVLSARADNAIKYSGKNGTLTAMGFYSTGYDGSIKNGGEQAGAPRVGREMSAGLRYMPGPLDFGLVFDQRNGSSVATQNDLEKRLMAGVSYTSGTVKTSIGYRWLRSGVGNISSGSNLYWGGLQYQMTPAFSLATMMAYTDTRGSNADPMSTSLLGKYHLTKRSSLYLMASYAHNQGGSNLGVNGIGNQIAAGSNQTGIVAGMFHHF